MGRSTTGADRLFAKPLYRDLVRELAANHELLIAIEEGAIGGFGAHVLTIASEEGLTDAGLKIRTLRLQDVFQEHDKPEAQYAEAHLDAEGQIEAELTALCTNHAKDSGRQRAWGPHSQTAAGSNDPTPRVHRN